VPAKIRKSTAAQAIGISAKSLDHWLQLQQVTLRETTYGGSGWTDFSPADIVHLRLVSTLVGFGLPVELSDWAINAAEEAAKSRRGAKDPAARWRGKIIRVQQSQNLEGETIPAVAVGTDLSSWTREPAIIIDAHREATAAVARLTDAIETKEAA
jgi:hypothetical protein